MYFKVRRFCTRFCTLLLFFALLFLMIPVAEAVPYRSYIYDFWETAVPAPQAYLPARVVYGTDLGVGDLDSPQDLFISPEGRLYIADAGNNRVIVCDRDWNVELVIDSFTIDGREDGFNNPRGIFAGREGRIYVADRDNARIVLLDSDGNFLRTVGAPDPDVEGIIPEDFRYRPRKLGVDQAGRLYVIADDVYDGIMEFDVDGNFRGFLGAPRVAPSMVDYMWRRFATEAQRERMALFLPTEYSNLDVDPRGFIYTTVSGGAIQEDEAIRRLNPSGEDVLRRMGFSPPIGDYGSGLRDEQGNLVLPRSVLVDIVSRDFDIYSALDRQRGRVFTYDSNGNLLYVFGGLGDQKGLFRSPVALGVMEGHRGDNIVVLDSRTGRLTIFEPTAYARAIHSAIAYYNTGQYDRATEKWRSVLRMNANYDLAYTGIGRAMMRTDSYSEAMHNFRLGQNRPRYSEAFQLYRREILSQQFGTTVFAIFFLIILIILSRYLHAVSFLKEKLGLAGEGLPYAEAAASEATLEDMLLEENFLSKGLRSLIGRLGYAFHLILHPIGGFWDLKHERLGSIPAATVILVVVSVTYAFMRQYTGFIFNPRDLTQLNVFIEVASVLLPFALWCIVNWSLTTLMEGKGRPRDIYIYSAYALFPLIVINIPLTVISNFITLDEGAFFYLFLSLAVIWSALLMFFGTMVIHDYDMGKTTFTIILIGAGIGIVLFIGLLLFSLIDQVVTFVTDIYSEAMLRL